VTDTIIDWADELDHLRVKVAQLEHALTSRVVIEQAKGILGERFQLSVDDAFQLLRRSARNARTNIHNLAHRVVAEPNTPPEIAATLNGRAGKPKPTG
jgi:AmiR/NasT family two-component response regulator